MSDFWKKIAFIRPFLAEIVVYACLMYAYFLLVLHHLGNWIKHVYGENILLYAIVALLLIGVQGIVFERLAHGLLWMIEHAWGMVLLVRRLTRPHETITRPSQAPGLLTYRFAGPLFFFNAVHFAKRVRELIESADPPVTMFLINAEAIVEMDASAAETLEQLHDSLAEQDIVVAVCEAKGHFLDVLQDTVLMERPTFHLYPSVSAAIEEIRRRDTKD